MGFVIATALAATPSRAQDDPYTPETILDYAQWAGETLEQPPEDIQLLDDLAQRLADLADRQRSEEGGQGAGALEHDPGLANAARVHAIDMLERGYVDHVGPQGFDVGDRIGILHRTFVGGGGENIGEQTGIAVDELEPQLGPLAARIMDGFMQSPGHRENLLDPEYTHHGMAAVGRGDRLLVVHVFGARRALLAEAPPLEVQQGDELALEFATGDGLETPASFGYAQPGRAEQAIVPLELSLGEVTVDPGVWRLEFFFPTGTEGTFAIARGPIIVVR